MIRQKIDKIIREIPDFPKEGIKFKDITPLLLDQDISNEIIDSFIYRLKRKFIYLNTLFNLQSTALSFITCRTSLIISSFFCDIM